MKNVYDNGALMLGNLTDVITEIKKEIKQDTDMIFADKDELLNDLRELLEIDKNMIVCINYDTPMGNYEIDYWASKDMIKNGGIEND